MELSPEGDDKGKMKGQKESIVCLLLHTPVECNCLFAYSSPAPMEWWPKP